MVLVPNSPTASGYSSTTTALSSLGAFSAGAGLVTSVIGAYYGAQAARDQGKSQALALEFQQTLANINARAAEIDAQGILRESQRQMGRTDLQYRALARAAQARLAARGVQAGVGSAGEIRASIEYARQSDRVSITTSGVRAANAARMQAVNARNQAIAAGVGASNLRIGAQSINPGFAGGSALLQGLGGLAGTVARTRRADLRYNRGEG